ncbi:uncharacterized mitochondrial protein AtMg00810-like [Beta vulgaris subsp. vulgaris]|uniref:uncharacterized mitochondrial protein AtMg00810-like n=1 Tax=Beta vulgaris subsp. vulgaris TaxID=3555 RepID=UPI002036E24D|nr:uncharacterized mitochondrial protein AtMg00810-like [Beta vulgaris subsp. vulgaris]
MKCALDKAFAIKDHVEMKYFLGIEVARNERGIMLNQRNFIIDILNITGNDGCKPTKCPFSNGIKQYLDEGEVLDDVELYRSIIGKLLYLNLSTPDISYSVQQLSQFMAKPRKPHFQAVIHVIKYLSGTINQGLIYPTNSDLKLTCFCDSDWGNCAFSARSLTGYCVFLGNSLKSWKTKKHKLFQRLSRKQNTSICPKQPMSWFGLKAC